MGLLLLTRDGGKTRLPSARCSAGLEMHPSDLYPGRLQTASELGTTDDVATHRAPGRVRTHVARGCGQDSGLREQPEQRNEWHTEGNHE